MGCGCECLRQKFDEKSEVRNVIPQISLRNVPSQRQDQLNMANAICMTNSNSDRSPLGVDKSPINVCKLLQKRKTDREFLSIDQQKTDAIFDYFNDLRMNPQNFLKIAKQHNLYDLINSYLLAKTSPKPLKQNRFFNYLLDSYVKRSPDSDDIIFSEMQNEVEISEFDKKFYVTNAPISDLNEAVWNLLSQNKDKALQDIFLIDYEYVIIHSHSIIENNIQAKVYFIFLKEKE